MSLVIACFFLPLPADSDRLFSFIKNILSLELCIVLYAFVVNHKVNEAVFL